jgi:hypothetical protein
MKEFQRFHRAFACGSSLSYRTVACTVQSFVCSNSLFCCFTLLARRIHLGVPDLGTKSQALQVEQQLGFLSLSLLVTLGTLQLFQDQF